jgi:hypothetical protein
MKQHDRLAAPDLFVDIFVAIVGDIGDRELLVENADLRADELSVLRGAGNDATFFRRVYFKEEVLPR